MKNAIKKNHSLTIRNFALCVVILFGLTACDNRLYNRLFRNPHIVEVAEVDSINSNEWYEFETDAKAFNKVNEIYISFTGDEGVNMSLDVIDYDAKTNPFGTTVVTSTNFPGQEIKFDVTALDADDIEYDFVIAGSGGGIIFEEDSETSLIGKTIKKIRVKSNLDHENINVTWVSVTRK